MFFKKKICVNIYIAVLLYLFLSFFLLFISRFFFYEFNKSNFPGLTVNRWLTILGGGFRFDLAATLYINSLFILLYILPLPFRYNPLYQKITKTIFFVTNGIALCATCVDFIYFRYTLRRSTIDVFREFSHEKGKGNFLFTFLLDYWYILFIYLLFIAGMVCF